MNADGVSGRDRERMRTMLRENPALRGLEPEERDAFCREVIERLSDIVEGKASPELMSRVESLLGHCDGYAALRRTLEATIELAREVGEEPPPCVIDSDALDRCVSRARRKLLGDRDT